MNDDPVGDSSLSRATRDRVVVAVGNRAPADRVLDWSARWAQEAHRGLALVCSSTPTPYADPVLPMDDLDRLAAQQSDAWLQEVRTSLQQAHPLVPVLGSTVHEPVRCALRTVARDAYAVVVPAPRRPSAWHRPIHAAPVSVLPRPGGVLVVVGTDDANCRTAATAATAPIVLGMTTRSGSARAAEFAFTHAEACGRPVAVVHVVPAHQGTDADLVDARRRLAQRLLNVAARHPRVRFTIDVLREDSPDPATGLRTAAESAALLVVGLRRRHRRRLRPSGVVSRRRRPGPLVSDCPCPLAIVP